MRPNHPLERQLSSKSIGGSGSGRDSRSRLAALPRRCELEVSVRPLCPAPSYEQLRCGPRHRTSAALVRDACGLHITTGS